jgi:small subunit ribosomal protein S6
MSFKLMTARMSSGKNPSLLVLWRINRIINKSAFHKLADKTGKMNNYELMVIFTPVLSDDEFKAEQKKYAKLVTDAGGSIVAENPWGLKSLAYPIQKKTTGLYWVLEYTAAPDFNEKLKIQLLRDETVLRHLCTKLDKYAVEYNARKKSGVKTGTEKLAEV